MFWPRRLTYSAMHRIVDDLGLALDFLRQSLAEGDFLFQRIEVDAAADVAIADLVGILILVLSQGASGG